MDVLQSALLAHRNKVYFSGPLLKHNERLTNGQGVGIDEGWIDVWAQLRGAYLTLWTDNEPDKQHNKMPQLDINVTNSVSCSSRALISIHT